MVLFLGLLGLFIAEFSGRATRDDLQHPEQVLGAPAFECVGDEEGPTAEIELSRMDEREGTIRGSVTLCFSEAFMKALRVNGTRTAPFRRTAGGRYVVLRRYRDKAITVRIAQDTAVHRIRLGDLRRGFADELQYEVPGAVTFAADGYPQDFPEDRYDVTSLVTASAPAFYLLTPGAMIVGLSVRLDVRSTADLQGWTIRQSASEAADGSMRLVVQRPVRTRLFSWLLVFVPLLLILSLLFVIRSNRVETLIGAAGVLIALLPIRAVLVPADLDAPTLVDLALGCEVGLLAMVMAWAAAQP